MWGKCSLFHFNANKTFFKALTCHTYFFFYSSFAGFDYVFVEFSEFLSFQYYVGLTSFIFKSLVSEFNLWLL